MTLEELKAYTEKNKHHFHIAYLRHCLQYANKDAGLTSGYHIHHIIPRCLGGKDEPNNLIKISIEHHKALHKNIIQSYRPKKQSNTITKSQYKKLVYAMCLMNNIELPKYLRKKER